jgi:hypothetical protein
MGLPNTSATWVIFLSSGEGSTAHSVTFLKTSWAYQLAIACLHLDIGHFQVLAGEVMDVVQPLYKVGCVVCFNCSLSGGASNIRSQDRQSSRLNSMLASVTAVVSWVDSQ